MDTETHYGEFASEGLVRFWRLARTKNSSHPSTISRSYGAGREHRGTEILKQCCFYSATPAGSARDSESCALDAIDWHDPDKKHKALKSEVTKFQKATLAADAEGRPSVGLGTDFRLESRKVTGFALALDDKVLHVSIFARTNGQNNQKQTSRMERYTHRRRNRTY